MSSAELFLTPLGEVTLDPGARDALADLPQVKVLDEAHATEHSLEVHLPFLQEILDVFTLIPLVVGEASTREVSEVLERLWGGPETRFVISSDLSHYHDYTTAGAWIRPRPRPSRPCSRRTSATKTPAEEIRSKASWMSPANMA